MEKLEKYNANKYTQMYKKENYKRVPLELRLDYYNGVFIPAVNRAGVAVNAFIKQAIQEKIERDQLQ